MTVQDGGRYGYQETGIQVSGAMDQASFKKANYLVGNDETEAVLEVTLFGGMLEFTEDTIVAVTGADMGPMVDEEPVEMNCPLLIQKGQTLTLGTARQGCRTYLAFAGGIDVPLVMGKQIYQSKMCIWRVWRTRAEVGRCSEARKTEVVV